MGTCRSGRVVGKWDVRIVKIELVQDCCPAMQCSSLPSPRVQFANLAAAYLVTRISTRGIHAWTDQLFSLPAQMAEVNSQPVITRMHTPSLLANSPAVKAALHLQVRASRRPSFPLLTVGTTFLPCFLGQMTRLLPWKFGAVEKE